MRNESVLLRETLKESFFFRGLSEDLLTELENLAIVKSYDKNAEIFAEGQKAFGFFLILEGYVKVYKLSPKGKEQIIHLLGPGEVFAEVVLSGVDTYPAYAQAISPVKVALFEKSRFLKLIQRRPELAMSLIGLFATKLRSLIKTIENLTLKEAGERLLHYLWELSEEGKNKTLELKVNKTHLALLLGITPETLSRLFHRFREEGIIELEKNKITLLDLEKIKNALSSAL